MLRILAGRIFAVVALFALVGAFQNLSAQDGGGAGDPANDPAPRNDKVATRGEKPKSGRGRGGPAVDPASIPTWNNDTREASGAAASASKALLIVFLDESDTQQADNYFSGKDIAEISKNDAIFVRIAYTKDRDPAPDAPQNILPVDKVNSDNPSRDYKVTSYPTFVLTDPWGNEVMRFTSVPTAGALKGGIAKIVGQVESESKKLEKNLEAARKTWEAKDYGKTLKSLEKNFKEGVFGLQPQKDSIALYNEMVEAARAEIGTLTPEGDGLKRMNELKSAFKPLDKGFASEIEAAIKKK